MSPTCSSSSPDQYSTSESFALVHRPAPNITDKSLHKTDGQDQQPLNHHFAVSYCTLRTRLGLEYWKCGRRTKAGPACPHGILRNKRDHIESLIGSMILLSQESPELVSKVERLAQLAHCRSHTRKDSQDSRKTVWLTAFPARDSEVRCLEEQVRATFGYASAKCSAAGPESSPCGEKIGGRKVQNFQRIIDEIMRLNIYLRDSHIDHYLGILEKNIYCSLHELTMPHRKNNYWKSKILEIRTVADVNVGVSAHIESTHESECQNLYSDSTGHCRRSDINDQQLSILRAPPSSEVEKNQTPLCPEKFDTTPFPIKPKKNKRSPIEEIQRKIDRQLCDKLRSPGYIYVFQAIDIEGYLKIGYTTSPVIERLQSLVFDCNRQMKVVFPLPHESAIMVPNAWRVEQLCHAELVDRQVYFDCTGCLCEHKEWFQISAADALPVVKKWSAWMNSTPYHPALGSLKAKERGKLSDIDHFMRELAGNAE